MSSDRGWICYLGDSKPFSDGFGRGGNSAQLMQSSHCCQAAPLLSVCCGTWGAFQDSSTGGVEFRRSTEANSPPSAAGDGTRRCCLCRMVSCEHSPSACHVVYKVDPGRVQRTAHIMSCVWMGKMEGRRGPRCLGPFAEGVNFRGEGGP